MLVFQCSQCRKWHTDTQFQGNEALFYHTKKLYFIKWKSGIYKLNLNLQINKVWILIVTHPNINLPGCWWTLVIEWELVVSRKKIISKNTWARYFCTKQHNTYDTNWLLEFWAHWFNIVVVKMFWFGKTLNFPKITILWPSNCCLQ